MLEESCSYKYSECIFLVESMMYTSKAGLTIKQVILAQSSLRNNARLTSLVVGCSWTLQWIPETVMRVHAEILGNRSQALLAKSRPASLAFIIAQVLLHGDGFLPSLSLSVFLSVPLSLSLSLSLYTHTHTHTCAYIYVYRERCI